MRAAPAAVRHAWAHESRFVLDPSERRLQAERSWGLSSSDHYFLIILGPERTVDAEQSGSRAELAPVLHDTGLIF